ncbi:CRISPR-associated endonuclease Cas3'' [Massilia sp. YIM B04103]|uniref:CRISPR-associated endonuclease Cas3'' n=1 Tax=Massilia sp. YIM B04103 TaxID=2963106 RepID=UPI00210E681E|nr:CRISPR-associated endonuclease Cas3'' [Massilia sp. YIM B04103]
MSKMIPEDLKVIWAKSGDGCGHSLVCHMLDVATVVEAILDAEPPTTLLWAARQFGFEPGTAQRWLAALAGLHDFGKAIPGFQAKWDEGMRRVQTQGFRFTPTSCAQTKHDLATAALLGKELHALAASEPHWLQHSILAISAHHGYPFLPVEINQGKPVSEHAEWAHVRRAILRLYWQAIAPGGFPGAVSCALSRR